MTDGLNRETSGRVPMSHQEMERVMFEDSAALFWEPPRYIRVSPAFEKALRRFMWTKRQFHRPGQGMRARRRHLNIIRKK